MEEVRSEQWFNGWYAYQSGETVDNIDEKPEEWKNGFYSAMQEDRK